MTDDAERFVADVSAVPFEFWIALVVLSLLGGLLAWATERAPYDPYADRGPLDVWDQPTQCGHVHGGLTCNRAPHHDGHHTDYHTGTHRPITWREDAA